MKWTVFLHNSVCQSECAPYAFRLNPAPLLDHQTSDALRDDVTEEKDVHERENTCDDNGELSAGAILAACLRNCEKNYKASEEQRRQGACSGNILLVVTRKVNSMCIHAVAAHSATTFNSLSLAICS